MYTSRWKIGSCLPHPSPPRQRGGRPLSLSWVFLDQHSPRRGTNPRMGHGPGHSFIRYPFVDRAWLEMAPSLSARLKRGSRDPSSSPFQARRAVPLPPRRGEERGDDWRLGECFARPNALWSGGRFWCKIRTPSTNGRTHAPVVLIPGGGWGRDLPAWQPPGGDNGSTGGRDDEPQIVTESGGHSPGLHLQDQAKNHAP